MPDNFSFPNTSNVQPWLQAGVDQLVAQRGLEGFGFGEALRDFGSWAISQLAGGGDGGDDNSSSNGQANVNGHSSTGSWDKTSCAPIVDVQYEQRAKCPKGYVCVEYQGRKVCMTKALARSCKLWKPPTKPPISARNWGSMKRAKRAVDSLDRVVETANAITGKADLKRTRPRRNGSNGK